MSGGKLKEVRGRIRSVISTQQITKAMKMVSAAKLRKAQDSILKMRPYANKLSDILYNIAASQEGAIELEYSQDREVNNVVIVLFTSDRGLCGGFNSNLIKKTLSTINEKYKGKNVQIMTVGKKGNAFFKSRQYSLISTYTHLLTDINFDSAAEAANFLMEGFSSKKFDKIELVYSQFKNAAVQGFVAEQFLPIAKVENEDEQKSKTIPDYIFEPSRSEIIESLVPKILKTQFYRALLDTNASEHGARMTAMDQATENANELLKDLRISYNRARQAAITTELTEIVSGAAALEGA